MLRRSGPRALISLTALVTLVAGLLVAVAAPASAAPTRSFASPVFSANATGDIIIRGNTLMTCPAGSRATTGTGAATGVTCENAQSAAANGGNNYFLMGQVDVDSDGSTFNSSSATIAIPTGATVLFAGLSWAANTGAGSYTPVAGGPSYLQGSAAPTPSLKNQASFKAPGASSYTTVTSTQDDGATNYQSFADVTTTVAAAGSGTYTMANVQAGTGGNSYAGWSLTIAYQKSTLPYRNLVAWMGYDTVTGASPVAINVSSFLTPATGHVVTRVGTVSYEGDYGSGGDAIALAGTDLFNSLNPVTDVFNSSLTDLNVAVTDRSPAYANLLGMDIDRFEASGILANGASSAVINLHTGNDVYFPGVVTFATDLYPATLTGAKTVTDVNGGTVSRTDRLDYSTVVTSTGQDAAVSTVLTDAIPVGTTYVLGSLRIGGVTVSDAVGDDAGDVVGPNVTARLGTGATGTAGGRLATGASTTVSFSVTVNTTITDGSVISSIAIFGYNDETGGAGHTGASNTTETAFAVPLSVTSNGAITWDVTVPFSRNLAAADGIAPYTWSVSAGTLPAWLTLSPSGTLSGTPTATGVSTFTVQVVDTNGKIATKDFTFTVVALPSVTTTTVGPASAGVPFSKNLAKAGGTGTVTWSVSAGALPPGLSMDAAGLISGTPTAVGSFDFTARVADSTGGSGTKPFTLVVGPLLTYASPLPQGVVGVAYSNTLTESGGTSPFVWTISAGTLPAGLTIDSGTGRISGNPTTAGTSNFTVTVTDANGQFNSTVTTLTVVLAPVLVFAAPAGGEVGLAYSTPFTAAGGTSNVWSISSGSLPAGLTLNTATGVVTGTPTAAGTRTFTVQVVGNNGHVDTKGASITIAPAPSIISGAPLNGVAGIPYSATFIATGGVGAYTWSVSAGSLPTGLTLDASTGVLSGTPATGGTTTFTVKVTDTNAQFATQPVSLLIKSAATLSLASSAPSVNFGTTLTLTSTVTPSDATGTVTFTDVPTSGPQVGNTVTLGTATVSSGTASLTVALPAFGLNPVTAAYGGDGTHSAATALAVAVEVHGYTGEVIASEFRTSGPGGALDSYVELYNTGPEVPLAGFVVSSTSGVVAVLPGNAGTLGTNRSYLLAGSAFSLGAIAHPDLVVTLGTGGVKVQTPDTAITQTDAAGPATGFHVGTGLPAITGTPTDQHAWVRIESRGRPKNNTDNLADFKLVSTATAAVGGATPTLGSPSPTGRTDPYQHNATLLSTLLDPLVSNAQPPNRVSTSGPRTLTIRRTITNYTLATLSSAKVRVTALSELNGAPYPGATPPATKANLRVINPATPTSQVVLTGGSTVTVQNLSVDAPSGGAPGGGLNSTLTVPLGAGLAPGATVNIAFTFAVDSGGTFWFGYDVEAADPVG